jgi:hypothetical protein
MIFTRNLLFSSKRQWSVVVDLLTVSRSLLFIRKSVDRRDGSFRILGSAVVANFFGKVDRSLRLQARLRPSLSKLVRALFAFAFLFDCRSARLGCPCSSLFISKVNARPRHALCPLSFYPPPSIARSLSLSLSLSLTHFQFHSFELDPSSCYASTSVVLPTLLLSLDLLISTINLSFCSFEFLAN